MFVPCLNMQNKSPDVLKESRIALGGIKIRVHSLRHCSTFEFLVFFSSLRDNALGIFVLLLSFDLADHIYVSFSGFGVSFRSPLFPELED